MRKHTFDILIVGGGITGLTLALALAKTTTLQIAILEANSTASVWDAFNYHHRVSAITLTSKRIFQSLNIWPQLVSQRVSPFRQISVWDDVADKELNFNAEEIAEPYLGYIIENNLIQQKLLEACQQYANISRIAPVRLRKMQMRDNGISLVSENQEEYEAKLAVAADGVRSWLRQESGMSVNHVNYEAAAIVTHVKTALPHEQVARQAFTENGPLAFLPLAEPHLSSIVWSLPNAMAKQLLASTDDEFKQTLEKTFKQRLGGITGLYTRYTFPLHFQQCKRYVETRVVLIGDAAHHVHPLAGQGVNIGILDAATLAEVISNAYNDKRDFAKQYYLRQYERWRKADNLGLILGIEWIRKIFASEDKTMIALRQQGLQLTNNLRSIKKIFMHHAIGERSRMPRLAK